MPTDDEIEQVARNLCKQFGFDPDAERFTRTFPPLLEKDGAALLVHQEPVIVRAPRWHSFKARALAAIMDHRAVTAGLGANHEDAPND